MNEVRSVVHILKAGALLSISDLLTKLPTPTEAESPQAEGFRSCSHPWSIQDSGYITVLRMQFCG